MANEYDSLKLSNQLCFPLYAAAREIVKRYHPLLTPLDLTYTQYVTMMVLWEEGKCSARDLGLRLFLDSGTLTPVLKSLEAKGFVRRYRSRDDERVLTVEITPLGMDLREKALSVPPAAAGCVDLDPEEAATLYRLLYKFLEAAKEKEKEKE